MALGTPQVCDILIRNGYIVTMNAQRTLIPAGAIAIRGHTIVDVGPEISVSRNWKAVRTIDAGGSFVHPGYVDAHLHVNAQSCRGYFRGDASKGSVKGPSYADWKAELTGDDENAATALAAVEMLRHGITTFVEPGSAFDPDAVADAARAVGVRCTLSDPYLWDETEIMQTIPGLMSPALARRVPPDHARCMKLLGGQLFRNHDVDGIVHGHIALYGEGTASDELLRASKALADKENTVLNSHIGYDLDLAQAMEKRWGKPRFVHLRDIGVLGPNLTFVHMNLIGEQEVDPILSSDVVSVWCPFAYASRATVMRNPTPLPGIKKKGAIVALGTDSARQSSSGDAGFLAFVLSAEIGQALQSEEILEMLTLGGARAAGLQSLIGAIVPGMRADIVIRSGRFAEIAPGVDAAHQLVAVAHGATADTVLVNGKLVLRHGQPTNVDEGAVIDGVRKSVAGVAKRLGISPSGLWPKQG
jgi:5-methylthioadenosine/S-adenosylhomocysteine deaminase